MQTPNEAATIRPEDIIRCLTDPAFEPQECLCQRPQSGLHKYVNGFTSNWFGDFVVISGTAIADDCLALENLGNADNELMLILKNCEVTRIELKNCHFRALHFYDSEIKLLSLKDVVCKELKIIHSRCDFIIGNSNTLQAFQVSDNSQAITFSMERSIIDRLTFEKGSGCDSIQLHTCCYCDQLIVSDKSHIRELIWDRSYGKELLVSKGVVNHLSLRNKTQLDQLHISTSSEIGDLSIVHSHCGVAVLKDCRITSLYAEGSSQSLQLINTMMSDAQFIKCRLHLVHWESGVRGDFVFRDCIINTFKFFKGTVPREAVCTIISSRIYWLAIIETIILGQFSLRNVSPLQQPFLWEDDLEQVYYSLDMPDTARQPFLQKLQQSKKRQLALFEENTHYESPLAAMIPEHTRYRPVFRIINSSLGKTEITGSELRAFKVEFSKSKLLDMYINGAHFTKENIEIVDARPKSPEANEQLYFFYSQLKKVYEAQGDIIAGTKFHSLALQQQEKVLKDTYKDSLKGKDGWESVQHWLELKTFQLNHLSNRHGESWPQALLFIFRTSIVLYVIYCLTLWGETKSLSFAYFAGEYFSFLDPTHKQDFLLPKAQLNPVAKFVDFLGRVLIGYAIFQFIAAFRRHGRR